jgi:predicted HicB family RNase H-like nuclease
MARLKQVSVPLDDELRRRAEAAAERERRSLANWIRLQIERAAEQEVRAA